MSRWGSVKQKVMQNGGMELGCGRGKIRQYFRSGPHLEPEVGLTGHSAGSGTTYSRYDCVNGSGAVGSEPQAASCLPVR